MKLFYIVLLGLLINLLSGCAAKVPNLKADKGLQTFNPMKEITLLGSSSVYWPRNSGDPAVLGLKSSQSGIENLMVLVKNSIEAKGYQVVFSEPVVVGFPRYGEDKLVYADYDELGPESKWNQDAENPTYIYPVFAGKDEVKSAAIDILKDLDDQVRKNQFNLYSPDLSSIQTVAEVTGADTICAVRVYGIRYSTARAVGAFFAGMLVGRHIDKSDRGEAAVACVSSTDGKVLWQKSYALNEDPMDVDQNKVNTGLTYFPAFATNLSSDCEYSQQGSNMYYCD
ncbi:MAG: hypothetical protein QNJ78_04360 [Gammaproteobacteria bacterium]|nr:hypothetical protein [Gammaproteobacteria bacterium]